MHTGWAIKWLVAYVRWVQMTLIYSILIVIERIFKLTSDMRVCVRACVLVH